MGAGSVRIESSAIAAFAGTNSIPDVEGVFTSLGGNFIGNRGAVTAFNAIGDQTGTSSVRLDPKLGALADNGGPTLTHAPLRGSPLIDAGSNLANLTVDQRGASRGLDANGDGLATADIGAVEFAFFVTTTADTVDTNPGDGLARDANGQTSLRAAIMESNALAGPDAIFIPAGIYTLTRAGRNEDAASTGDLDITGSLSIVGASAAVTTINGGQLDRVFDVAAGKIVQISGLTITGGKQTGRGLETTGDPQGGGAIHNTGLLSLADVVFDSNTAEDSGGAILSLPNAPLTVTRTTFRGNSTSGEGSFGGAVYTSESTVQITDSLFELNRADGAGAAGGALALARSSDPSISVATITGSVFDANFAAIGGAVFLASVNLTATSTQFINNQATGAAGALFVRESLVRIQGGSFIGNQSQSRGGAIILLTGSNLDVAPDAIGGTLFSGNQVVMGGGGGGAISLIESDTSATILGARFVNNSAHQGGAIEVGPPSLAGSHLTVRQSSFVGNQSGSEGGAILVQGGLDHSAVIESSTFSGTNGANVLSVGDGGVLSVTNSTISSSNSVDSAILAGVGSQVTLTQSTIANNIVRSNGSNLSIGALKNAGGTFVVRDSIVTGTLNLSLNPSADVEGTFVSLGHNLISNAGTATGFTNGVNGDRVGTSSNRIDAKLGPLASNGGLTQTHALLVGSPAIDAGTVLGAESQATARDQRGVPRPQGVAPDIGAFEVATNFLFVNSEADSVDINPGDGIVADAQGRATLRAAIMESNARAGVQTIVIAAGTYRLAAGADEAVGIAGDLDITAPAILIGAGSGETIVEGNGDRVFDLHPSAGSVTIVGLQVRGGGSSDNGAGGGIRARAYVTLRDVVITGNQASLGGGLYVGADGGLLDQVEISQNSGAGGGAGVFFDSLEIQSQDPQKLLRIEDSWIHDNATTLNAEGGGLHIRGGRLELVRTRVSNNSAADGGGLFVSGIGNTTAVTFVVQDSLFDQNSARSRGGAIYNFDSGDTSVVVELVNTTLADNSAVFNGGAVHAVGGRMDLTNVTVSENSTLGDGGGLSWSGNGGYRLLNTVVTDNSAFTLSTSDLSANTFVSLGHNLIGVLGGAMGFTNGVNGDLVGSTSNPFDAKLGPLADNGGPTMTMLPRIGSPLIEAGDNTGTTALDQRGLSRIVDGNNDGTATIDIGAVERFEGALRGVVFYDSNGDGDQDAGEPGLAGRTVYLDANRNGVLDAGERSTVTVADDPATAGVNEAGTYFFDDVAPGGYIVREVAPVGTVFTTPLGLQHPDPESFPLSRIESGDGSRGVLFNGTSAGTYLGNELSSAGDLNADGFDDMIFSTEQSTYYVVFGRGTPFAPTLDVTTLDGTNGFRIVTTGSNEVLTRGLAGIGDFNGDGIDDLAIGGKVNGSANSGFVSIVRGRTGGFAAQIDLASDALSATRITNLPSLSSGTGLGELPVSAAGDVNADGIDDLLIGASRFNNDIGAAYVVFGSASVPLASISAASLSGANGFRVTGTITGTGLAVSAVGDVNGDGFDDVGIGASGSGGANGAGYIVFGKSTPFVASFSVSTLNGSNGFAMTGTHGSNIGQAIAGGDLNGDGFDDVVLGGFGYDLGRGEIFVVYGQPTGFPASVSLNGTGAIRQTRFTGPSRYDRAGFSIDVLDFNGDGFDDVVMGAYLSGSNVGKNYLVFGQAAGLPTEFPLSGLFSFDDASTAYLTGHASLPGVVLSGASGGDRAGFVANAGDVNGDGLNDLLIGAAAPNNPGGNTAGKGYVVFGQASRGTHALRVNSGVASIGDFGNLANLSINDVIVAEGNAGNTTATFTVTLSQAAPVAVTVNFATTDVRVGTGLDLNESKSGSDFTAASGTVTFNPGETTKTIPVTILGDVLDEFDEPFAVLLSNASNALLVDARGDGTITDNDALPSVSVASQSLTEGDRGTTTQSINVTLSAPSGRSVQVSYAIVGTGSATAGVDFVAATGTVTFAPGETAKTIGVQILGDFLVESNETFEVRLSAPIFATLGTATGTETITDDDINLTVNSTLDKVDLTAGDGAVNTGVANEITLRAAVMTANQVAGDDEIVLPAGMFTFTLGTRSEDAAASGDLDVTSGYLRIRGAGAGLTIIDAADLDRVFQVRNGATLELVDVTLRNGELGDTQDGGAIAVDASGTLILTRTELAGHNARTGGALFLLANSTLTVSQATFTDNTASGATGLGGAIATSGAGITLNVADSTFRNNKAISGGAIFSTGTLTVSGSTFESNRAEAVSTNQSSRGGAIFTSSGTTLSIASSTFLLNTTTSRGSGQSTGGGVAADTSTTVTITGSTFERNAATAAAGATGTTRVGGGLWTRGAATITNSTFSANTADFDGGGLFHQTGTLSLNHVTIARNVSGRNGGGIAVASGSVSVKNSLIATNTSVTSNPDVHGTFVSLGHNLIGNRGAVTSFTAGQNGDLVGEAGAVIDPKLLDLANNGGPTKTHALEVRQIGVTVVFSPAVDAGDDTGAPQFDQRGFARDVDGRDLGTATVDIGAFELPLNRRPTLVAQSFTINENSALGSLIGRVAFGDPDGNLRSIAITDGDRDDFTFDAVTGDLFVKTPLDFEADASYSLTLRATDTADLFRDAVITINVANVNERPALVGSGLDNRSRRDGDEPETVDLSPLFVDPDVGDSLTFSLVASTNPALVDVRLVNGHVLSFEYLDYSAGQNRSPATVTVRATDAGGLQVSDTFVVSVAPQQTFEYALVITRDITPQVTAEALPTSLASVLEGADYFVEVWVRDRLVVGHPDFPATVDEFEATEEILAAGVDLRFDPSLSMFDEVITTGLFNGSDPVGVDEDAVPFNNLRGLIDNLNGRILLSDPNPDTARLFARVGAARFRATGLGLQTFALDLTGNEQPTVRSSGGFSQTIHTSQILLGPSLTVGVDPNGSAGATRLFAAPLVVPLGAGATSPTSLAVADFDGLNGIDLVSANGGSNNARVVLSTPQIGYTVQLNPGDVATGINFGNRALAGEIRGVVFADANGNGEQDTTEAGLAGWTVFLDLDNDGVFDQDIDGDSNTVDPEPNRVTQAADPNNASSPAGEYVFRDLKSLRSYTVGLKSMDGNVITGLATNGGRVTFTLDAGQMRDDVNFGIRESTTEGQSVSTIDGFVFEDFDHDRLLDPNEGLAGIVVYVDLNGDGHLDATEPRATTIADGSYTIFTTLRAGSYQVRVDTAGTGKRQTSPLTNRFDRTEFVAGGGPQAVAVGNFNTDSLPDIAVANEDTSNVTLLLQSLTAGQVDSSEIDLGLSRGFGAFAIVSGNFDGMNDGDDLAVANTFTKNVSILRNTNGVFGNPVNVTIGAGPRSIIAVDLDGDGDVDLNNDGDVTDPGDIDRNNDGKFNPDLDLVTTNEFGRNVSILTNNGTGTFSVSSEALEAVPLAIAAADVLGDSKPELLVTLRDTEQVAILSRNANGRYTLNQLVSVGDAPFGIVTGDFNGDHLQDFAVTRFLSNSVAVFVNQGGFFLSPRIFAADVGPAAIVAIDLEGDGDLDLAVTHQASAGDAVTPDVSLLRNEGLDRDGRLIFSSPESAGVLNESSGALRFSIAARDLDGNGAPDLIIADKDSERISVLRNTLHPDFVPVLIVESSGVTADSFTLETLNQPPSFTKGENQLVDEDVGTRTISNWATSISSGGANEPVQAVDFVVMNDNNNLFSVQPAISADGTLTYTSAENANGFATVTVRIHDNGGTANGGKDTSDPQTFRITVTARNDKPVADAQSVSTPEDTAKEVTLTGADRDPEVIQSLTFTIVMQPAHGRLGTLNASTGRVTYTPDENYHGADSFAFRVTDDTLAGGAALNSDAATVSLTVESRNDVPMGRNDTYSVMEDTTLDVSAADGVLFNDIDVDGDSLTVTRVDDVSHGTLTLNSNGSFTYRPSENYHGSDSFTYRLFDGQVSSELVTVNLASTAINDDPIATPQDVSTPEDIAKAIVLAGLDGDPEVTQILTFAIATQPSHGALSGLNSATGAVTYTPSLEFNGMDSFTFTVTDDSSAGSNALTSTPVMVRLTVNPVNDRPVANAQQVVTDEDLAVALTLTGNDNDAEVTQTLSFTLVAGPSHGTLSGFDSTTGAVTYTPNLGYFGADSFTFTATDDTLAGGAALTSTAATVDLTVRELFDVRYQVTPATSLNRLVADTPNGHLRVTVNNVPDTHADALDSHFIRSLTIIGGAGADTINLSGLSRDLYPRLRMIELKGEAGVDAITASDFDGVDVRISGGAGNDALKGGRGNDRLVEAQTGAAKLTVTLKVVAGKLTLAGFGTDTIEGFEEMSLTGGSIADNINVDIFTGNATLFGGGGNDTLVGGRGNDRLDGDAGDDSLTGNSGNDQFIGGSDNGIDTITESDTAGSVGSQFVLTPTTLVGLGSDTLSSIEKVKLTTSQVSSRIDASAFGGSTSLTGGNGNDVLIGGTGADSIVGGKGSDMLTGGLGKDTLTGGTDAGTTDTLIENVSGIITVSATSLITATPGVVAVVTDTLSGIDAASLTGGSGSDTITASALTFAVTLLGGGGNDSLVGGSAGDLLDGQSGDDTLTGGLGADTIGGGVDGVDLLIEVSKATAAMSMLLTDNSLSGFGGDTLSSFEHAQLTGGSGIDTISAEGFTQGSVTLLGGGGNDTLTGTPFDDFLSGQLGDDCLLGGNGNDTLTGEAGADKFNGGAGTDRIVEAGFNFTINSVLLTLTGNGTDSLLNNSIEEASLTGTIGANTLTASAFSGSVTLNGLGGDDKLFGGSGPDLLNGGDGKDSLEGNEGNDMLVGGAGQDTLLGGAGADNLDGGDDHDILDGQADQDVIIGGAGRDILIGGTDADVLSGGADDDILIGGTTSLNVVALKAILAEWTSAKNYTDRVSHLRTGTGGLNGTTKLDASTLQNDNAIDRLFGDDARDLFFGSPNDVFDAINTGDNQESVFQI